MQLHRVLHLLAVSALVTALSACASFKQYRTNYELCPVQGAEFSDACREHALHELDGEQGSRYLFGFAEFDDQGQAWDRRQHDQVLARFETEAANQDLLMVVFVHGWKHSARPGDGNIETFRRVLAKLAGVEAEQARRSGVPGRWVAGLYVGWRGASMEEILGLENLTFWDRKNTAQKVGLGDLTSLLARLELIKLTRDGGMGGNGRTKLAVVGHSFGGLIVHSALSQILQSRFVRTKGPDGAVTDPGGFGNLVVMINPAVEALAFAPLSNMSAERGTYFPSQLPVLVSLTSQADSATRTFFPLGRNISTLFEREAPGFGRYNAVTRQFEPIDEQAANVTALGHFLPFRTHTLKPTASGLNAEQVKSLSAQDNLVILGRASMGWANDAPGSTISFAGLELQRSTNSAGRNPYLVVSVDGELIKNHNDIDDERIIEFIKQMILISSLTDEQRQRVQALPGVMAR